MKISAPENESIITKLNTLSIRKPIISVVMMNGILKTIQEILHDISYFQKIRYKDLWLSNVFRGHTKKRHEMG